MELEIERIDDFRWRVPRTGPMRVDGLIFADETLMRDIRGDDAVQQVANVATLPGIVKHSIGMPDIHWGYGFAIGGVAAFDPEDGGVISPGGVGYDINCGVRLLRSDLTADDVRPRLRPLMDDLFERIPAGVGQGYDRFVLSTDDVRGVLERGARWAVDEGLGYEDDLEHIEDGGRLADAEPDRVSERAVKRGRDQLGTVGSGNHFIEVGYVDDLYDADAAEALGLAEGTVTVFIHSGSRGLGYQVCDDNLDRMLKSARRHGIDLEDDQLACAPLESDEAKEYIGAMRAAANYAFANRQVMAHRVRRGFREIFGGGGGDGGRGGSGGDGGGGGNGRGGRGGSGDGGARGPDPLGMRLVYDVAHNIAKLEPYDVNGKKKMLCVHRKGATRAFPAARPRPLWACAGRADLYNGAPWTRV